MSLLDKIILGITDTHDASAAIVHNGKVLCAISEERIQRVKSTGGFPLGAINSCLEETKLKLSDIDYIALAGTRAVPVNLLGISSTLELKDYLKIQEKIRKPKFYENKKTSISSIFPNYKPKGNPFYSLKELPLKEYRELNQPEREKIAQYRLNFIANKTKKQVSDIHIFDHHLCHIYYAYYASPFRNKKVAALSLDGGGDGVYESISVFDQHGQHKRLHAAHEGILGPIYSMITLLLRMKPNEHEFKVMGLAPYAKEYHKIATKNFLKSILSIKGIKFIKNPKLKDFYFSLVEALQYERFDGIAGGAQDWLEENLATWVSNVIDYTNTKNIIFSGGVALNVKANLVISSLNKVENIFVPPGSGDESLSIGACWALLDKLKIEKEEKKKIQPLNNSYLGSDISKKEIEDFKNHPVIKDKYNLIKGEPNKLAAKALLNNEIIAICRNRMEFGPRSLGHRSLIANPSSKDTVSKINSSIKGRDFWMPFAPSIIEDEIKNCIEDNSKCDFSYMTFTANSKVNKRKDFIATIHPYDSTMRVHSVSKKFAPSFYDLISCFYKLSGIPGVLNTSLNIHGKPIIMKPIDLINELLVVEGVKIDNIIINNLFFKLKEI